MARQYAVTIRASRTEVEPKLLAQRLAKLLDRPLQEVEAIVEQETVLLEHELSYAEAIEIQRELSRRRIPSQVSAQMELDGEETLLRRRSIGEKEGTSDEESDRGETDAQRFEPRDLQADGHEEADLDEEDEDETSAWAELFPDLAEPSEAERATSGGDGGDRASPSAVEIDALLDLEGDESSAELVDIDDASWDGNSLAELDALDDEAAVIDVEEIDFDAESVGEHAEVQSDDEEIGDQWSRASKPGNPAPIAAPGAAMADDMSANKVEEQGFDAGKIRRAFVGNEDERPPFKPRGYDQRPEHVPLLAAILSLLAPGAGQIFNGQPDKAQRYAVTFFLLYPWFASIRQAMKYGEKVRTYYAPRPEEGATKRALIFGLKWWFVVILLSLITGSMVSIIQDYQEQRERHRQALVMQDLVYFGIDVVAEGVDEGWTEAENTEIKADDDEEKESEYTMDDEERARRLFIIGYHHCRAENFALCQQLMSRVTSLAPHNREAFRLQAWASMQARNRDPSRGMPEVEGDVPTLEEFELQLEMEGTELEDIDENYNEWWDDDGEDSAAAPFEGGDEQREYGEWWDELMADEGEDEGEEDDEESTDGQTDGTMN